MFDLFTNKFTQADLVTNAKVHALREKDPDIAVQQFVQAIQGNQKLIRELRETSRKTVQHMFRGAGIKNEVRQKAIHEEIENMWERILAQTVREYLQDCRNETRDSGVVAKSPTIEFAAF